MTFPNVLIFLFFRISELKTAKKIVVHIVNCFSPQTMLSQPTYPVSFFSTKLSTKRLLMELHSSKSWRRRELFPELRLTAVLLTWWLPKANAQLKVSLNNCNGFLKFEFQHVVVLFWLCLCVRVFQSSTDELFFT